MRREWRRAFHHKRFLCSALSLRLKPTRQSRSFAPKFRAATQTSTSRTGSPDFRATFVSALDCSSLLVAIGDPAALNGLDLVFRIAADVIVQTEERRHPIGVGLVCPRPR